MKIHLIVATICASVAPVSARDPSLRGNNSRGLDGECGGPWDPCMMPSRSSKKYLVKAGDNGKPSSVYPLGKCEGDCDNNGDCAGNLVCFQRKNGDTDLIPGCSGKPYRGVDYCYDRGDDNGAKPTPRPTNSPPKPTPKPTSQPRPQPTPKPTSKPTPKPTSKPPPQPTRKPTSTPRSSGNYLVKAGDNGKPSSVYPLGQCEGDCDNNGDCAGNLVCFQRKNGDTDRIPGCSGKPYRGVDYCYDRSDDNGVKPTPRPTNRPPPKPTPKPTSKPTSRPAKKPTSKPTSRPTRRPTNKPRRQDDDDWW